MKKLSLILMVAMLSFSACGDSDSDANAQKNKPGAGPAGSTGAGLTPSANVAALPPAGPIVPTVARIAGQWTTNCLAEENNTSVKNTLFFGADNQNRVLLNRVYFGDANCGIETYKLVVAFNVKDDGTATDTTVDLLPTLVFAEINFIHEQYVQWANTNQYCGKADWAANVKFEVTKKECNGYLYDTKPEHRITVMGNPDGSLSVKIPDDANYQDYRK